jgi:hypothetical protein
MTPIIELVQSAFAQVERGKMKKVVIEDESCKVTCYWVGPKMIRIDVQLAEGKYSNEVL